MPQVPDNDGETTEIATGTLAEIYAQQGLVERALEIYRRIARRSPDDEQVASRIRELTRELEVENAEGGGAPLPEQEPVVESAGSSSETLEERPGAERIPPVVPTEPPGEPATHAQDPHGDHEFLAWLEKL